MTKQFTFKNIIIIALLLVVLYLLKCSGTKPVDKPAVISVPEQKEIQKADDAVNKRIADSFQNVIAIERLEKARALKDYDNLLMVYSIQQNEIEETMLKEPVPDTCRELQDGWIAAFNKLGKISEQKDAAAKQVIDILNKTSTTKDSFLIEKDRAYAKLRVNLDTCWAQQTKLQDYVNKVSPKREINIGTALNYKPGSIIPGVTLGYRTKKGLDISTTVFTNRQVTVGIKTTLFKF